MSLRKIVGDNLLKYRKKAALTQEELGQLIGADQGMISRIETYKVNVELDTLEKLCKSLHIHFYELVMKESELVSLGLLPQSIC